MKGNQGIHQSEVCLTYCTQNGQNFKECRRVKGTGIFKLGLPVHTGIRLWREWGKVVSLQDKTSP